MATGGIKNNKNYETQNLKRLKLNLVENYWFTLPAINNSGCLDICFLDDGTIGLKSDYIIKIIVKINNIIYIILFYF